MRRGASDARGTVRVDGLRSGLAEIGDHLLSRIKSSSDSFVNAVTKTSGLSQCAHVDAPFQASRRGLYRYS